MQAMESANLSIPIRRLHEIDDQDSDPPSEDESDMGDPFNIQDMGSDFVFTQPEAPPLIVSTNTPSASPQPAESDGAEPRKTVTPIREIFAGAGAIQSQSQSKYNAWKAQTDTKNSPYTPFASQLDYSVAKWAKELGPGDTALSKLLAIPGVSKCSLLLSNRGHLLI